MKSQIFRTIAATATLATAMFAQNSQRQATIVGGGGPDRGKCTLEVVVDDVAQVEIRGTTATLRTLSGQPAQWRRFECTGAMPVNPANFRFAGVDGRGRQELTRDPRNGGVAVVQIEDKDGGAEGYTFDITWDARGPNTGGNPNAGPVPGGNPPNYQDRDQRGPGNPPAYGGNPPNYPPNYQDREPRGQGTPPAYGGNPQNYPPNYQDREPRGPGTPPAYGDNDRNRNRSDEQYRPNYRDSDYYRRYGHAFGVDEAVRVCQQAVVTQAARRFRTNDIHFHRTAIDDNPGREDWVTGTLDIHRGPREERFGFSCSVNFDNGRVRSAELDPRPLPDDSRWH
jgi:hypothetical protein